MRYPWEKGALGHIKNAALDVPSKYVVIAVAVANTQTGEAALIEMQRPLPDDHDVTEADYRKDIMGDAKRHYERTLKAVFGGVDEA